MSSILVVDDEPDILETTRWAFEAAGYEVLTATTGEEALEQVQTSHPQVLLIDFKLPKMNGVEFLEEAQAVEPNATAVMITGMTHQPEILEGQCKRLGVRQLLHKPLQMDKVLQIVREALSD